MYLVKDLDDWRLLVGVRPLFESDLPWTPNTSSVLDKAVVEETADLFKFDIRITGVLVPVEWSPSENALEELLLNLRCLLSSLEALLDDAIEKEESSQPRPRDDTAGEGVYDSSLCRRFPKLVALDRLLQNSGGKDTFKHMSRFVHLQQNAYEFKRTAMDVKRFNDAIVNLLGSHRSERTTRATKPSPLRRSKIGDFYCSQSRRLFQSLVVCTHHCKSTISTHHAMMQLNHIEDHENEEGDASNPVFSMLLGSCPAKTDWIPTHCTVSTKVIQGNESERGEHVIDLCQSARRASENGIVFRLELTENHFLDVSDAQYQIKDSTAVSMVSLQELRSNGILKDRYMFFPNDKKILAFTLAHGLLNLLDTPWLQTLWTMDKIFFLRSNQTGMVHNIHQPYVSSVLSTDAPPLETLDPLHSYSIVLSFAKLLWELETGEELLPNKVNKHGLNSYWVTLRHLCQTASKQQFSRGYSEALDACVNFPRYVNKEKAAGTDLKTAEKQAILKYIVHELESEVDLSRKIEWGKRDLQLPQHRGDAYSKPVSSVYSQNLGVEPDEPADHNLIQRREKFTQHTDRINLSSLSPDPSRSTRANQQPPEDFHSIDSLPSDTSLREMGNTFVPLKMTRSWESSQKLSSNRTKVFTDVHSKQPDSWTLPPSLPSGPSKPNLVALEGDARDDIEIHQEDGIPDDVSMYSADSKNSDMLDERYQDDFVADIHHQASCLTSDETDIVRVGRSLERILHLFAIKIAREGEDKQNRVIAKFVGRHRGVISQQYHDKEKNESQQRPVRILEDDPEASIKGPDYMGPEISAQDTGTSAKDTNMYAQTRTADWIRGVAGSVNDHEGIDPLSNSYQDDNQDMVRTSSAYQWLNSTLKREVNQAVPTSETAADEMYKVVLKAMKPYPISRKTLPPLVDVTFVTTWRPNLFLKEQNYDVSPQEAITKALVLVGIMEQAEGVACHEYLLRTWPDTAHSFIQLMKSVVKSDEDIQHIEIHENGTKIEASIESGTFTMNISGYADTVIEIGEQLMWVSCALRQSPPSSKVLPIRPVFEKVSITGTSASKVSMQIALSAEIASDVEEYSRLGTCWTKMFKNPLVVKGFPIPHIQARELVLGLRLALSTIMVLMPGSRVSTYRGKLFIKRFSMLLVAIKKMGDIVFWHAISKDDGSQIYYHDSKVVEQKIEVNASLLSKVDIATMTHVIGWTTQAHTVAGTNRANFAVKGCGLGGRKWEFELERFTIGISQQIVSNATVKVGRRETDVKSPQDGDYQENIETISEIFVVLYDVKNHRGFLLDGASTLLYLAVASLNQGENSESLRRGINDSIKIHDHADPKIRATNALLDRDNMTLQLYCLPDGTERKTEVRLARGGQLQPATTTEEIESRKECWKYFKDRVTRIHSLLELAANMSTDTAVRADLNKMLHRKYLEGYDFRDLTCRRQAKLRVATPKSGSKGWIDLVKGLPALTLFGRDFGDIICSGERGEGNPQLCDDWRSVPTAQGYLTISNSMLKWIITHHGDSQTSELIRERELYVKCPRDIFEACQLSPVECARSHILVRGRDKKAPLMWENLPDNGAVIIGCHHRRSIRHLFRRKNHGAEKDADPPSLSLTNIRNIELTAGSETSRESRLLGIDQSTNPSRADASLLSSSDDTTMHSRLPKATARMERVNLTLPLANAAQSSDFNLSTPQEPNPADRLPSIGMVDLVEIDNRAVMSQLSISTELTNSSPRQISNANDNDIQDSQGIGTASRGLKRGLGVLQRIVKRRR